MVSACCYVLIFISKMIKKIFFSCSFLRFVSSLLNSCHLAKFLTFLSLIYAALSKSLKVALLGLFTMSDYQFHLFCGYIFLLLACYSITFHIFLTVC